TPDFYADPEDRARFLLALREHGVASEFEMVLKRGNGELFWSMISGRIISYEGQPAIVSSVVDINARKRAEELLAKQANELSIVAKVSTAAATTLEPQELLQQVVDLTKSSFELYHAHIHLLDEATQMLSLTAGAGDVGRAMVAEGRYIPLTANGSLVAAVARSNAGAIRHYESPEEGFMPHPLLTETRSEMAVPIAIGSQVLGVLDVRSDKLNYFRESDLRTVTTLASQVAVALQNARSYTRSEAAIQELQEISRRLTREGWDEFVEQQVEELTFAYLQEHLGNAQAEAAGQNGHHGAVLSQPLQVQGEPIGELLLEGAAPHRDESIEIVQAVADHLSAHLENLRLAEQSERDRAAAEKRSQEMAIINEIVTQISTSLDLQHSLQIIVDELATAVNVDQVRVALIQPNQQDMLVIAEHFDATRTPSAVGMTIPLEGNELTLNVINTRQMAVIEDAQNNPRTAPVHELFREQGIETVILLPLVVNDEVIGTVGMDILDKRSLPRESLRLAETIVYQTATAIQNARLFEQIQSALAETEMLYSYSSQLNTATSLDAVLDSAVAPGFQVGATKALLLVYDRNSAGNPEYGQIAAVLPRESAKVGASLYLAEQPVRHLWPSSGQNTVFVGDVWADGRLSPQDKEAFSQQDVRAVAIMYLTVGNLRLGQILIYWNKQQTFTNADERLYGAIAQQASSVVYNRLLFNQTEEALSETAALYQASADLNTAQTFEAVLTSLRQHTILGQASNDVTISFFNRNWEKDQIPEEIHVLASWQGLSAEMPSRYKLDAFPQAKDLLSYDEIRIYEDIVNDERINEEGRATFIEKFKTYAFVYAPLIIGTKRVGFISGFYPEAMSFSDGQIRRLNVLTRQAAVSLQSIRLYEQTQEALAQTEALYTGSERIVLSSTEDEILHSLVDSTELRTLDRANVFMFDQPVEDGVARDVTVVATWVNEGVPASVEVGTRFEVAHVPFLSSVNPEKSLVIHDIRTDPSVDEQTREILEGFGMISFVMFPIVVGSQWLGMVSGQSSRPLQMNEVHMRQANSLVSQAAVVMQTTILFRQEQARARREHLLREIAAKVRSSSDIDTIMRTAVTEIGRTLGRRTFIKLNNEQSDSDQKVANGVTP
ncbi:MAG: GAF domain-containing protein, partial [Anaerolineales bacterium]|nr:GAF domain-containing protein [Anaerolineales bacterium]